MFDTGHEHGGGSLATHAADQDFRLRADDQALRTTNPKRKRPCPESGKGL